MVRPISLDLQFSETCSLILKLNFYYRKKISRLLTVAHWNLGGNQEL